VWVTHQPERVFALLKIPAFNIKSPALLLSVINRQHGNNNRTIPFKDRLSQQFFKAKDAFSLVRGRFWNTIVMMFYLNVFYLPTLKDVVAHYKLWN